MMGDDQIEAAVARIRDDPKLIARYDVTGDGELDDQEWELVRRMVALELKTADERKTEWNLDDEPEILNDRFELIGLLGRGGQAYTHLARDMQNDGEHVVIKELNVRVAADWKSIELFEREAEVLERLAHPSIPRYVDAFHLDDAGGVRFMLVQQFVDGTDLGEFVARGGRWREAEAVRRLTELCDVLDYLHTESPAVIHRDIKPSNLILGRDDRLYLVDFGAVQTVVPTTVGGSTIIGTSGYVPMEQYMGRAVPSSDIYALGATTVHLMCGIHPADLPFEHGTLEFGAHLNVTPAFGIALKRMLQPTTERRYASAKELAGGLRPLLHANPEPVPQPEPERSIEEITRQKRDHALVAAPQSSFAVANPFEQPSPYILQVERRASGIRVMPPISVLHAVVLFVFFSVCAAALVGSGWGLVALVLFPVFSMFLRAVRPGRLRVEDGKCELQGEGMWQFAVRDVVSVDVTAEFISIGLRSDTARLQLTHPLSRSGQRWLDHELRQVFGLEQQLPK